MWRRFMEWLGFTHRSVLDELPVYTGSNVCRNCGATDWSMAKTDPNEHFLRAGVIACNKCQPGMDFLQASPPENEKRREPQAEGGEVIVIILSIAGVINAITAVICAGQKEWLPAIFFQVGALLIWQMIVHRDAQ